MIRRNGPHLDQQGSCRRFLSGSPSGTAYRRRGPAWTVCKSEGKRRRHAFFAHAVECVCDVNPDAGYIDVLYPAGPKTQALCKQPIGEELSCLGPLGHPFTHPDKGTDCVLVGGGIGVPPMIFLGRRLMREGFDVALLIGARSAAKHLSDELLEGTALRIGRATDDGSLGHCGLVTDLLRQELESAGSKVVYTCGPHAMIEAVADVSREFAACQVSLEEYMACGIGICVGCVVRVENAEGKTEYGDYKRICVDGPVFDAREICWEH